MSTYNGFTVGAIKRVNVTGGAAATTLTATGIATDDTILSVTMYATRTTELATNGTLIDLAEVTIAAAEDIRISTTDTTSYRLVVEFFDKSAFQAG